MKILMFTSSFNMQLNFRLDFMLNLKKNGHVLQLYSDIENLNEPIFSKRHHFHSFSFNFYNLLTDVFRYKRIINNEVDLIINYTVRNCFIASILHLLGFNNKKNVYFIAGLGRSFHKSSLISRLIVMIISKAAVDKNRLIVMNNRDYLEFSNFGVNPIFINSEGLDVKSFPLQPLVNSNELFRMVFIGRVIEEKGINDLLKLAYHFRDNTKIIIEIFGDTSQAPVDFLVESKKYPNLKIRGFTTNPMLEIANSNVLLLPSMLNEGLPRIMLEAFSIGRICVAYDIPGCRDVYGFTNFKDQYLATSFQNFVNICENLLELNIEDFNKIGLELHNSVVEYHEVTQINQYLINELNL